MYETTSLGFCGSSSVHPMLSQLRRRSWRLKHCLSPTAQADGEEWQVLPIYLNCKKSVLKPVQKSKTTIGLFGRNKKSKNGLARSTRESSQRRRLHVWNAKESREERDKGVWAFLLFFYMFPTTVSFFIFWSNYIRHAPFLLGIHVDVNLPLHDHVVIMVTGSVTHAMLS